MVHRADAPAAPNDSRPLGDRQTLVGIQHDDFAHEPVERVGLDWQLLGDPAEHRLPTCRQRVDERLRGLDANGVEP